MKINVLRGGPSLPLFDEIVVVNTDGTVAGDVEVLVKKLLKCLGSTRRQGGRGVALYDDGSNLDEEDIRSVSEIDEPQVVSEASYDEVSDDY